jgi:outer membrane usher protein
LRGTALAILLLAALTSRSSAGASVASVQIPIYLDGREIGDVPAFLSEESVLLAIDGGSFALALRPYLLPGTLVDVTRRIDAAGRLSPEAIRAGGIGFIFDAARLEARVEILVSQRPVMPLNLAGFVDEGPGQAVPPAALSGYVNLLAGGEYSQGDLSGAASGWQRPIFDFDGAVRASSTVLEGIVTHSSQIGVPWQRQDVRLVYDLPQLRHPRLPIVSADGRRRG